MVRIWICLSMLAALGCAGPPAGPAIDLQEERNALMKADKAWFDSHENIDKFLTFLTDDATFMPDGAPLARGDSIRTTWEYLISLPGFNLEWQATGAKVSKGGDMGYTIGTYELTVEQDGVSMVTVGKYVTLWEKQVDQPWRVAVDCFNSDGPPTGG